MVKPLTTTLTQVYGSVAEQLKRRIGDAQAAAAGPPVASDIKPAGDQERVKAWWARRPEATDQAMQQMAQQRYQEHLQAGLDDQQARAATAEDLTHFRYGQRAAVYTYGQPGFDEQVKEAKRIAGLARRESTPDPQPPTPTMASAQLTNAAATQEAPAAPPPLPPAPDSIAALLAGASQAMPPPASPGAGAPAGPPPSPPGRY